MLSAKILIAVGVTIALAGLLLMYAPGLFSWFGTLPGDIRIEKGSSFIYIPITSMLLVSLAASLLLNLLGR